LKPTAFHEITRSDVGKTVLRIFGRTWPVEDFMGRIYPFDVGKRIFLVGDILQVENDEQRDTRIARRNPLKALRSRKWKIGFIDRGINDYAVVEGTTPLEARGSFFREYGEHRIFAMYPIESEDGGSAAGNPDDEFADYDPSDREILNDVKEAFESFEKDMLAYKRADPRALNRGFTVTHGYVPAWRSLLSADTDRRTSGLSKDSLESGILNEMFDEVCQRLGDKGIIIWDDDGDGTVLWAGTEEAYEKYSGEG